jgi:hypothetical protein
MTPRQEQLRKYIEHSVGTVCPYNDKTRNRLYRLGFLEAYLACILTEDPIMFKQFKNKIGEMKDE